VVLVQNQDSVAPQDKTKVGKKKAATPHSLIHIQQNEAVLLSGGDSRSRYFALELRSCLCEDAI